MPATLRKLTTAVFISILFCMPAFCGAWPDSGPIQNPPPAPKPQPWENPKVWETRPSSAWPAMYNEFSNLLINLEDSIFELEEKLNQNPSNANEIREEIKQKTAQVEAINKTLNAKPLQKPNTTPITPFFKPSAPSTFDPVLPPPTNPAQTYPVRPTNQPLTDAMMKEVYADAVKISGERIAAPIEPPYEDFPRNGRPNRPWFNNTPLETTPRQNSSLPTQSNQNVVRPPNVLARAHAWLIILDQALSFGRATNIIPDKITAPPRSSSEIQEEINGVKSTLAFYEEAKKHDPLHISQGSIDAQKARLKELIKELADAKAREREWHRRNMPDPRVQGGWSPLG